MTKKCCAALALIASMSGVFWPASARPRTDSVIAQKPFIPFTTLARIALTAQSTCAEKGHTVSVTVVDRDGTIRVTLVGDDAAPLSTSASYRKAYTAANVGITTADFRRLVETPGIGPVLGLDPLLTPFGGGMPIKIGRVVVGGIGVSGADRAEADEECALAGLALLAKHSD